MKLKIEISKTLEDWWVDDETARELTDTEILELVHEDIPALLDGALWNVKRLPTSYDELGPGELNDIDA